MLKLISCVRSLIKPAIKKIEIIRDQVAISEADFSRSEGKYYCMNDIVQRIWSQWLGRGVRQTKEVIETLKLKKTEWSQLKSSWNLSKNLFILHFSKIFSHLYTLSSCYTFNMIYPLSDYAKVFLKSCLLHKKKKKIEGITVQ